MNPSHERYGRARTQVLEAQAALEAAETEMQAAEADVRPELEAAWDANRLAVEDAVRRGDTAMRHLVDVETEVGAACRERWLAAGGVGPAFFTDEELARVAAAKALVDEAKAEHEAAQAAFKLGPTVDQLVAAATPQDTRVEAAPG